jgi:hypothetical protein
MNIKPERSPVMKVVTKTTKNNPMISSKYYDHCEFLADARNVACLPSPAQAGNLLIRKWIFYLNPSRRPT